MAQTHLTQEELKALETTRKALFALSNNIASLKQDILRSTPLPQWSATLFWLHVGCVCADCWPAGHPFKLQPRF